MCLSLGPSRRLRVCGSLWELWSKVKGTRNLELSLWVSLAAVGLFDCQGSWRGINPQSRVECGEESRAEQNRVGVWMLDLDARDACGLDA